jgi:aryl-alcohol dehydrogenase-like predicted oxidoreductase
METVTLGRTGLHVSRLALGGLFISSYGAQFEQARLAAMRAVELGVNYIDTAPGYLDSEEVVGKILKDVDAPVIVSTKLGYEPEPFRPRDKDSLRESVDRSMALLGRDVIDILMIHEPDRPGQFDWFDDLDTCEGPVTELLEEFKREGRIRFTGVGGTTTHELARVVGSGKFDVVLTAFNYSLLYREAAIEVFPAAQKQGTGVIAGSPLQQGAFAVRRDDEIENGAPWLSLPRRNQFKALYGLLDETGMPIVELAMRFVISHPAVDCVLSGVKSTREIEQNIAYIEKGPLPDDILRRLDEIYAMVSFRPFSEPLGLPFGRDYKGPGVPS